VRKRRGREEEEEGLFVDCYLQRILVWMLALVAEMAS